MNITNLPCSLKEIKIIIDEDTSIKRLLKIPYDCKILDINDNIIKIE